MVVYIAKLIAKLPRSFIETVLSYGRAARSAAATATTAGHVFGWVPPEDSSLGISLLLKIISGLFFITIAKLAKLPQSFRSVMLPI